MSRIDDFRQIFISIEVEVICVSETSLNHVNVKDELFALPGFKRYCSDRPGRIGGGAAIYLRNKIKS